MISISFRIRKNLPEIGSVVIIMMIMMIIRQLY